MSGGPAVRILNWIQRVLEIAGLFFKTINGTPVVIDSDVLSRFLLSVVNADDRSPLAEKRVDFAKRYEKWFPPKEGHLYKKANYRDDLEWWKLDEGELQIESFHPQFGLHVAGLRYKLRVIWKVANNKEWESAERKVGYLKTDIHRYFRLPQEGTFQSWRLSVRSACGWLEKNVRRLKICKNPICESRYFIRKDKNQQYCGPACSAEGQSLGGVSQHKKMRLQPREKKQYLIPKRCGTRKIDGRKCQLV